MSTSPRDFKPRIKIEDPKMKEMAKQILSEMKLGILKGVAHEIDKETYPITAEVDCIENATVRFLRKYPQVKQDEIKKTVKAILDQPSIVEENLFGSMSKVDLKSSTPVTKQIEELGLYKEIQIYVNDLRKLENRDKNLTKKSESEPTITNIFSLKHEDFTSVHKPDTHMLNPITKRYSQLGGPSSFLGNTVGEEKKCPDGIGRYQHYEHGSIYWSPQTGAHEVHGAIRQKWESLGWETSFLGYPLTDEMTAPDGKGKYNHFQGGSIYWSLETGAHEVHGEIRARWASMGWEKSYLGYPVTDETKTPDTIGRFTHFQGGSIYWSPNTGTQSVHKNIRDKWESIGWELGYLGYPLTDTVIYPGEKHMLNRFQGGEIVWRSGSGATVTMPVSKLRLRIHKVKCIDETNPEDFGEDEIDLGGVACSINNGATQKIPAYRVSSFNSGDQKVYNPPREFCSFNLKDIPGWPKHFTVTMALAEIDSGGFNDFLNELVKYIRDKVASLIQENAGAIIGAALGAFIGAMGGILGSIAGALIGWLVSELLGWLIDFFEDDKFTPWTAELVLPSAWYKWGAYTDSPEFSFSVTGHEGEYQVWFDWELLA